MWQLSLVLLLSVWTAGVRAADLNCERINFLPVNLSSGRTVYIVRYNGQACDVNFNESQNSHPFCGDSGWGDEEAAVVCGIESDTLYGIGSYETVQPEPGYSQVNCIGSEEGLESCTVGDLLSESCSQVGVVLHCFNTPQMFILKTFFMGGSHYFEVSEDESARFCVTVGGPLTETINIHVETTDSAFALADYDYRSLNRTLTFETSNMTRSEQCLEIEIINDSLAEGHEMFTVQLSTNSSAVNLTIQEFDVFILPNDRSDSCSEGSVTVVSDVSGSSLQLVEMCSNEGVWSPVCDTHWTLEDATAICKDFNDLDTETIRHDVLNRMTFTKNATVIECGSEADALEDCSVRYRMNAACQYALVQCGLEEDPRDDSDQSPGGDGRKGLLIGVIAGVVVIVLVSLALVVVGLLILIVVKQKGKQINDTSADDTSELQDNPTYESSKEQTAAPGTDQPLERNLYNPLYTMTDKSGHQSHTYARVDSGDPEYAVPDGVHKPTSTGTSDAALTVASAGAPEKHEYEYVETPSTSKK